MIVLWSEIQKYYRHTVLAGSIIFRRVCIIAKRAYQFRHARLSARTNTTPTWRFSVNLISGTFIKPRRQTPNLVKIDQKHRIFCINPLNPELNPMCCLLAFLGAHHFLQVSRIRVKSWTLRRLMSYIYGVPILDVSRSHTTTQHSR